jgi:DNA replication protein DnaC
MNGQTILKQRRIEAGKNGSGIKPIAAINPTPTPTDGREFYEPPVKARVLSPVSIGDIDTGHHPKVANAVKMARAWADRKRAGYEDTSLILAGDNGTGKTHIARAIWWSITQAVTDDKGQALADYQRVPAGKFYMSNELIALMGNSRDEFTGVLVPASPNRVLGTPPMLVIDDLGSEQVIPFVAKDDQEAERQARLFKVIDYCYSRQVSVIVTTNLSIADFQKFVGRRSWDRLVEMAPRLPNGDSFIVDLFGVPSYRLRNGGR